MKFKFLIFLFFYIKTASKTLFQNQNDESECPKGTFGINCTKQCDEKCDYSKIINCNKETGECICISNYYYDKNEKKCNLCPLNCETCYSNLKCETCKEKKQYSDLCDKKCDNCIEKDGFFCNRNGKCLGECKEGFKGDFCNEECGEFCKVCLKSGECTSCIDDNYYLKDGICEKCWDSCIKCNSSRCFDCKNNDKFGDYCDLLCGKNCYNDGVNRVCDRNNGLCNKCKEHFKLPNCTECDGHFKLPDCKECEDHFTGQNCNQCSENFTGENCSDCILHKTGINCDNFCPSNCDLSLGNCYRNGTCRSCINGFKGEKCNEKCGLHCSNCDQYNNTCFECDKLFWGEKCENNCAKHCFNQICSKINGSCICEENFIQKEGCDECISNYTGEDCNENCYEGCNLNIKNCDRYSKECECKHGFYLKNCSMKCSENCLNGTCNNLTGYCGVCKETFYGDFCNDKCPNNCITCDRINGSCIYCEEHYYLKNGECIKCSNDCFNETCYNETGICKECKENDKYGDFCNKICPENCLRKEDNNIRICDRNDGDCYECKGHFTGEKCTNCEEKYYNLSTCEENCSIYCLDQKCNDTTGKCITCISTRYGDFCENECENCTNLGCKRETGYCIECDNNFYREGNICDKCPDNCESCKKGKCENCKEGFKGEKCNLPCNFGCEDNCNKENGECNNCKSGFYGKYCNLSCSGCHDKCYQENGECVYHLCKDNFYNTDKCEKKCSEKCINGCDLYTGECIKCDNGKWGKECEKECNEECNDVDCCFIKSDKVKSFELKIKNEYDEYDFITLYIGNSSIPMKILIDYSSRAPLMIFDNRTNLIFYQEEEKEKIKINFKYNRNLNKNENNSMYKIKNVEYSYMKCDGFIINDTIKFNINQNQMYNIFFFIPQIIDIDDDTDLSSIEISGVVGLNFLSLFTESLVLNNIITKNLFLKLEDKFLFGDFSEEIKKDNFKITTILKPDLKNYKLNQKNEFYAELSGIAVTNRKAYKYTLDKPITFKLKGDSEIVLSTSFITFFEKIYFNNYIKNNTCRIKGFNVKEFICTSIYNLPKLGLIIQNYTYYLNKSFLFKKIGDGHKFIIKFVEDNQKIILGKDFFNQYQVVYNNGKQILNFYGDTKKVNIILNDFPIYKNSYDAYLSPGLKSIIFIYSIVGLITFFYILKYCLSEENDFEYDYDDIEDIDDIFEKE